MTKVRMPTIQISRKGMTIWIGLILFISLWMFVLGILVGRGMAPVSLEAGKLEKELSELKAKKLVQEQEAVEAQAAGKGGEKPELRFYEALKDPGKEAPFKSVKPVAAPKPKRLPVRAPKPKPKPKPKPVPPPPVAAVPSPKPAPPPKEAYKPAPKPDPGRGLFSVQVASVQESQGAEKLVADLRKKGYQAYQIRSEVGDRGVWYRIRVGAFQNRGAAEKILKKLKGDKYGGMVVSTK